MQIYLFTNFSKRENSTKRPDLSSGTLYNCRLKQPTSAINPVVEIDQNDQQDFKNYSFAYIPAFYRYYIVADIVSAGHLWIYSLETDVLATYRDQIGSYPFYILRSSAEYNGKVSDSFYPGLSDYLVYNSSSVAFGTTARKSTPWETSPTDGCFVLGLQSKNATMGSIKYIAVDQQNMRTLLNQLSDIQGKGFNFNELSEQLTKQIVDPIQYIKTAFWVPLPFSTFNSYPTENNIDTGYMTFTGVSYKNIESGLWWGSLLAFPVQQHPQASRGIYLNDSPYTDYYLFAPPFGMVELPSELVMDNDYIAVNYRVDFITGVGSLRVYASNDPEIENVNLTDILVTEQTAQVCVPITMTQAVTDLIGMVSGSVQALTGAFMLSPSMMGAGLLNTVQAKQPKFKSVGGTGGIAGLGMTWRMYTMCTRIAEEDMNDVGRPLCEIRRPAEIPGFIMVRNGDMVLPDGTSGEHAAIKAYLENGFFYE